MCLLRPPTIITYSRRLTNGTPPRFRLQCPTRLWLYKTRAILYIHIKYIWFISYYICSKCPPPLKPVKRSREYGATADTYKLHSYTYIDRWGFTIFADNTHIKIILSSLTSQSFSLSVERAPSKPIIQLAAGGCDRYTYHRNVRPLSPPLAYLQVHGDAARAHARTRKSGTRRGRGGATICRRSRRCGPAIMRRRQRYNNRGTAAYVNSAAGRIATD